MKKLIVFAIAILGFTVVSFGQVTGSASSSATIIAPISITKTVDMNFGSIAVSTTAGTVQLTPAGVRNITGGITLPNVTGTVAAASFTVGGEGTSTYSIILPASNTIRVGLNGATMLVDGFSSTPSGTGALTGGTQTLTVGATLHVAGSQANGLYTSVTPFDVIVNYN